ncbi:MAG: hypothetical protein VX777_02770 [Chlamydiota bacterium]|nr:hypothetical protein [Chlamydiota bacterium]
MFTPIQKHFLPIEVRDSIITEKNPRKIKHTLSIVKFYLTISALAARTFEQNHLHQFDPIVHDSACQIRGLYTIFLKNAGLSLKPIDEKIRPIKKVISNLENRASCQINQQAHRKKRNQFTEMDDSMTVDEFLNRYKLTFDISDEQAMLLQSYLLSVGKTFYMTREGKETCSLDYNKFIALSKPQLESKDLDKIINYTQSKLSDLSVKFVQNEAEKLPTEETEVRFYLSDKNISFIHLNRNDGKLPKRCSSTYYNFKTVLQRLKQEQILLVIREHKVKKGDASKGFFYRSKEPSSIFKQLTDKEIDELKDNEPCFVIEGFPPTNSNMKDISPKLEEFSITSMGLSNAAIAPQFSEPQESSILLDSKEFNQMKNFAISQGLDKVEHDFFRIAHTHASSVSNEKREMEA